jgi:hypothetical protein
MNNTQHGSSTWSMSGPRESGRDMSIKLHHTNEAHVFAFHLFSFSFPPPPFSSFILHEMQPGGSSLSDSHSSVTERRALVRERQETWKRQRMIERDREIVESELSSEDVSSEDASSSAAAHIDIQDDACRPPQRSRMSISSSNQPTYNRSK